MNRKRFNKQLLIIALPMMIQFLITSSINLMDSFMIGRLGDDAVAALGIGNQYFFLFNIIIMGIMAGCNVLISQLWGKKDIATIKKTLGISLCLGIVASIIFTLGGKFAPEWIIGLFNNTQTVMQLGKDYLTIVCLGYIFIAISNAFGIASRSINKAVTPMVCSAIALVINIVLNYGLIFGNLGMPALGVKGAAIATLIARLVEMIVILASIYGGKSILKSTAKELLSFDREYFKKTVDVMIHVLMNELCWGLGSIIYSIIYGRMGTESMAAFQICITVQNLFIIVLMAVAGASAVMIGNEVGASNQPLAREYASRFMKLGVVLGFVLGIGIIAFSGQILSIYRVSTEAHDYALKMLYMTGIIMPVRFISVLLIVGILRGGGDVQSALKIEAATMWFIGVPICAFFAMVMHWEIHQVFAIVMLEEVVRLIFSMMRYKSGEWIRNISEEMAA